MPMWSHLANGSEYLDGMPEIDQFKAKDMGG